MMPFGGSKKARRSKRNRHTGRVNDYVASIRESKDAHHFTDSRGISYVAKRMPVTLTNLKPGISVVRA